MSLLIELAIYAAIAAALAFGVHKAWDGFKTSIAEPYVAAQKASDQKYVDASEARAAQAEADRDTARGNSAKCEAMLKVAQDATAEWSAAAIRAAAAAKGAKAAAEKEATARAPYIAQLQAQAAAAPKLESCQVELGNAKDVLREALQQRREK